MNHLDKQNIEDIIALTPMQEGMLFLHLEDRQNESYLEQLRIRINGSIDPQRFHHAWQTVVRHNGMLRCFFRWQNIKQPAQVMLKNHDPAIEFYDLSTLPKNKINTHLATIEKNQRQKVRNLESVPMTIAMCRLKVENWLMIVSNHHILYDGWSNGIILDQFFHTYDTAHLPVEKIAAAPFKDYLRWIRKQDKQKATNFWQQHLKHFYNATNLPLWNDGSKAETGKQGDAGDSVEHHINIEILRHLETFGKSKKLTLATLLYTAYGLLLQRYNNTHDVVFGTTVSGRGANIAGIENMVGLFINTVPLRVITQPGMTVNGLLTDMHRILTERRSYETTSLAEIKACSPMANQQGSLLDTIVVIENYPLTIKTGDKRGPLTISDYQINPATHYQLTLCITIHSEGIHLRYGFQPHRLDQAAVQRLTGHYQNLLQAMLQTITLEELQMISSTETEQLVYEFNRTKANYPSQQGIYQLFTEASARTPDAAALIGPANHQRISYSQLLADSTELAVLFQQRGISQGDIVAIIADRQQGMIRALLAVLAAGAAYLPISPRTPVQRIGFMLEDCNVRMVVTAIKSGNLHDYLNGLEQDILDLHHHQYVPPAAVFINRGHAAVPGYVIYTSGSTGRPKGVLVEQGSIINTLWAMQQCYPVTEKDIYLYKTSFMFDVSVSELLGWFWNGGALALMSHDGERDPLRLQETIEILGVTHINFVPSMFNAFVSSMDIAAVQRINSLKYIFLAGEECPACLVTRFRQWNNTIALINVYGPTEAAIYASHYPLKNCRWDKTVPVSIGKPLANVSLHILDHQHHLQPIGIPGQLCISGKGLARGYLNNPELTLERFNRCLRRPGGSFEKPPPGPSQNICLYKTGDLACWLPDGNILFLGRMDRQVKIRGYRIEPQEIENHLLKHPTIREAVVIPRPETDNKGSLCAYVVCNKENQDNIALSLELSRFLAAELPDYMIPAYVISIPQIPLTTAGKVHRAALPKPGTQSPTAAFVPPETEIQNKIADIWASVLELDKKQIGIHTNFFQLGGHSLKATSIASRFHRELNVKIPVSQVFNSPTVSTMETYIKESVADRGFTQIPKQEDREYYMVTGLQKVFYIQQRLHPHSLDLNMPLILTLPKQTNRFVELKGACHSRGLLGPGLRAKEPFAAEGIKPILSQLKQVFKTIILRHEGLRTCFDMVNGQPVQRIQANAEIEIETFQQDTGAGEKSLKAFITRCLARFIRPFDLSRAPMIRAAVIKTRGEKKYLLMDMHHIVGDGFSENIIMREFLTLYKYSGQQEAFPPSTAFKDFVLWQHRAINSGQMKEHRQYWLNHLKGPLPQLDLPYDYPRPWPRSFEGESIFRAMGPRLSKRIKMWIQQQDVTLYMFFMAVFTLLIAKISRQDDIIIGSPVSSRTHYQLSHTVGPVMNSMLLRHQLKGHTPFDVFLQQVKQTTLNAYEHQSYPLEDLLSQLNYKESADRPPVTGIALNVLNMFDADVVKAVRDDDQEDAPVSFESFNRRTSKIDITLMAGETDREILLVLEYCCKLFKRDSMDRLLNRFIHVIDSVLDNPKTEIRHIDIFTKEEKQAIINLETNLPMCPVYPLSHPQKRIYDMEQMFSNSSCNSLPYIIRYAGTNQSDLLEAAIRYVLQHHDSLHLRLIEFPFSFGPFQYLAHMEEKPFDRFDFSGEEGEEKLQHWLKQEVSRSLLQGQGNSLYYIAMLSFNQQEIGYYIAFHHLISDGWTLFMLFYQVNRTFQLLLKGDEPEPFPNPGYIDFIFSEQAYLKSPQAIADRQFWHNTLLPLPPEINLASGKNPPGIATARSVRTVFPGPVRAAMHTYCRKHRSSLYKLIFAVLATYMSRVSGEEEIVIAGAGHNRKKGEQRKMTGMFVSTLPFKVTLKEKDSVNSLVQQVDASINTIITNHQRYPYNLLMEELRKITGREPGYLLNVNLVNHAGFEEEEGDPRLVYQFPGNESSPLTIHINVNNKDTYGVLELEWHFQENCFKQYEIQQIHRCMVNLLSDGLKHPQKPLYQLKMLDHQQSSQLLEEFNSSAQNSAALAETLVHRNFENQVIHTPDHIAVTGPGEPRLTLSYQCLNDAANGLAFQIRKRGTRPGSLVGTVMEPGVPMVISLLAILKAGAAYVPLDPAYPKGRLEYILQDSALKLLISQNSSLLWEGDLLVPDEKILSNSNPTLVKTHHDAAYVIYTSGSTGNPKGVLVTHQNVCTYLAAFLQEFTLSTQDIVIQQASYTFDAFVEEVYPVIFSGGTLAIAGNATIRDITQLVDFILRRQITMITCSPLLLNQLDKQSRLSALKSVHTFISGGDVLHPDYIRNLLTLGNVYNTYGPTESTVCATYYKCSPTPQHLPIGKPIAGYHVAILSPSRQLLPIGAAGELCISGEAVSRGYLNNPELTAKHFYNAYKSYRSYRTGDKARWLADGNIQFIGRLDKQISIRGYRIEPGEIEHRLVKHPAIHEAAVICRQDSSGDHYLCAYAVPVSRELPPVETLKKFLAQHLPHYMIPPHIVPMEEIPMTPSGKPDAHKLPAPQLTLIKGRTVPLDDIETKLAEIWRDLLATDEAIARFSIHDDFIQLGGHSLKVTMLASRIHKLFNVKIPMDVIFKQSSLGEMAQYIRNSTPQSFSAIQTLELKQWYPLSSPQKRLFIMQQMQENFTGYNERTCLHWQGPLNIEKFQQALNRLVQRHETLRTTFHLLEDQPIQIIQSQCNVKITHYKLHSYNIDQEVQEIMNRFVRPFDLGKLPLLRVALVRLQAHEFLLLLDMHHIIADGTSMDIFVREFDAFYNDRPLPEPRLQYKDYCQWQNNLENSSHMQKQEQYWLNQFQGDIPHLNLPLDNPRSLQRTSPGDAKTFEADESILKKANQLMHQTGTTLFMLFCAVYNILLSRYCHQEDILIGTGIAGRRDSDLQDMMGMFVNMLTLRNRPHEEKSFNDFLAEVRETTLNAYENQDYPFHRLVEALAIPRQAGRNPLFDTQFTFKAAEQPLVEKSAAQPLYQISNASYRFRDRKMQFDLSLNGFETYSGVILSFQYDTALFKEETITDMSIHFLEILHQGLENPDIPLKEISLSLRLQAGKTLIREEEVFDYDF